MEAGLYGIVAVPIGTPGALTCQEESCGRSWIEDITPAGRCPWEYDHAIESEEDYALACDAMYAADPSNRCQHDNGVEDVEGVEVCEMCGETVEAHA